MKIFVEKLGINGEGVAKETSELGQKVCFVSGALPGEDVEVSIVADKKSYCECKLEKIIISSDSRVTPLCPYYDKCGGCDLQHMDKQLQMQFKQDKTKETIQKIAKVEVATNSTIRLNDYGYRNKMVFPVVSVGGKAKIGMFERGSHRVVDIDKCLLSLPIINEVFYMAKKYIETSFQGYNFKTNKGDIKYLVIRVSGEQVLLTIVATKKLALEGLYELISDKYQRLGLSLVISNSNEDIMSGKYMNICGQEYLEIEEFGLRYYVDNRGFLQVNNDVKKALYNAILDNIDSNDTVIDGYSGAGLLSAIIASKCRQVIGIEINKSASNSAKKLAKDNNLSNLECITSDIKDCIGEILDRVGKCTLVLDPARSGCDSKVLDYIVSESNLSKINKIIYVSCNPSTLARDLGRLKDCFDVVSATPWDMFPQTKHLEVLTILNRKNI